MGTTGIILEERNWINELINRVEKTKELKMEVFKILHRYES